MIDLCYTPDNLAGDCRSIYDCPSILSSIQDRLTRFTADYLRSLHCENGNGPYPYVCCVEQFNEFGGPIGWPQPPTQLPQAPQSPPPTLRQPIPNLSPNLNRGGPEGARSGANSSRPNHHQPQQPAQRNSNGAQLPGPGVCGLTSLAHRIFGGEESAIDDYPWLALLEYNPVQSKYCIN